MKESGTFPASVWTRLQSHATLMNRPDHHLGLLAAAPGRMQDFSTQGGGVFYDISRQRVNRETLALLAELAEERGVRERFRDMMAGKTVNLTEKRAALHTACRYSGSDPVVSGGRDVMPEIRAVLDKIRRFSGAVHSGELKGSTGRPFRDVVVVGIGGSYLGTEFVSTALRSQADRGLRLHYLSNVDIQDFGRVVDDIDPEATLWVIVSKSYTTAETLANTQLAYAFMKARGLDPAGHVVTVTSQGSPGDDPANPVLASFHMFDFIGGRYSVTSAVGGVPLSLFLGFDRFDRFLRGAEQMDIHAVQAPVLENVPLLAALISVWNNNFLGYPASAVIPYATPLSRLAAHVQQLNMESNGKSVTETGEPLGVEAGPIVFGEPGTNAQHSFFQLAHQGRPFPVEFIGVLRPAYTGVRILSKGVTNHQELWANLLAQADALALGKPDANRARAFAGNRPSSTLVLEDLSPESVGGLLSFYEAKTVFEAFVWGINPFDQFGVELGKVTASAIRKEMAVRNQNPDHDFQGVDERTRLYLARLFGAGSAGGRQ